MRALVLVPLLAGLLGPAAAQGREVVAPAGHGYEQLAGEGRTANAFAGGHHRELSLYDRSQLGFGAATIHALAWRRALGSDPAPGHSAQLVVRLATTAERPEAMSYRFAEVLGPAPVTVFSGGITLPPAGPAAAVQPFLISVPLSQPFAFDPALGNLAVDLEVQNPILAGWPRDARDRSSGSPGSFRTIAAPCRNSAGFAMTQRPTALDNCAPGRVMQIWVAGTRFDSPSVVHWIGAPRAQPVDLGPIGAPGCSFAVEPWAVLPALPVFPATNSFGYAWAEHRLPAQPALAGAELATQWLELDAPPGNSLGLILSDAILITLGQAGAPSFAVKTLHTGLAGSPVGQQLAGDRGAITRFGLR
jgi:hypothetical protein